MIAHTVSLLEPGATFPLLWGLINIVDSDEPTATMRKKNKNGWDKFRRKKRPVRRSGWKCMKWSTALWEEKRHTDRQSQRSGGPSLHLYSQGLGRKERWQFHHLIQHWCNAKAELCSPDCRVDHPKAWDKTKPSEGTGHWQTKSMSSVLLVPLSDKAAFIKGLSIVTNGFNNG